MYKIAVCDDELPVLESIEKYIGDYWVAFHVDFSIEIFQDGNKLLNSTSQFDLIFLDIEMPEINGIETARKIRLNDKDIKIVYVTSYSGYALQAFAVHPFDFIVKPVTQENIFHILNEYLDYASQQKPSVMIELRSIVGSIMLNLDEIIAFEYVDNRKLKVYITEKQYEIKGSITEIRQMIQSDSFTSPHKSFIINMKYVKRLSNFIIYMHGGIEIPVAQKKLKEFKAELNHYLHKFIIQEK